MATLSSATDIAGGHMLTTGERRIGPGAPGSAE